MLSDPALDPSIDTSPSVYCPKCGAYKGTQDGLHVVSQVCANGCESAEKHGRELISKGGGEKFHIRYNTDHIAQKKRLILPVLESMGYKKLEVPVAPVETLYGGNGGSLIPGQNEPHLTQKLAGNTMTASIDSFLYFAAKHAPRYLEITEGGKTFLLEHVTTQTRPVIERTGRHIKHILSLLQKAA